MRRVIVAGSSGAGKSTLARELAARLDLPYVELDALFHGAGWTKRPTFEDDVAAFTAEPAWVTDSIGYPAVVDLVWDRADALVWLDYPRWLCEQRVLRRSIARGLRRQPLWNGNRESLIRMVRDPEHPVRWGWQQHRAKRELVAARQADPRWSGLQVVRFAMPRDARRWLATL